MEKSSSVAYKWLSAFSEPLNTKTISILTIVAHQIRKMYSKEVLLVGFSRWLEVMNYEWTSVRYAPVRLEEFLDWMIAAGAGSIEDITAQRVEGFFDYLTRRKSKTTGEPLSLATQRNYLRTVNRFARYLRHSGQGNIPVAIHFRNEPVKPKVILSRSEVEKLYQITDDSLLGMRDRAMLAIFYGCGLRRNEAFHLEVKDILPDRSLVHVRRGKGHKSRYVPMVGKVKADLLNYLLYARPMLIGKQVHPMFFTGINGKPLGKTALYERLKKLLRKARIDKPVGLHSLRHSIATHLLQNGMALSAIARFLGHSSLESTQIYTHIRHELSL